MIILDTNVVSEAMKAEPAQAVKQWLNNQISRSLYLTSISLAELRVGIARLPDGRRKDATEDVLNFTLSTLIDTRILPFDYQAAEAYARIDSITKSKGKAIALPDGQIAAIAMAHGFAVATRDTAPFDAAGIDVINPWSFEV